MTKGLKTPIGVIGGGQLGKMLMEAGSRLNLKYTFLEKNSACPASLVCKNQVIGTLFEEDKILEVASLSDVITYEIEHVNVDTLAKVEASGKQVIPTSDVLKIIQDKGNQKQFFENHGIETLPYKIVSAENLVFEVDLWTDNGFVLKHRKGGYDGKGVSIYSKETFMKEVALESDSLKSKDGYVIEKLIEHPIELSVIVAIDQLGNKACYDVSEMVFDMQSNLMDYLICPSNQSAKIIEKAKSLALKAVSGFNSPGLFAVELFLKEETLFVNEIAPRPHNSGHHTIESAYCSQYEQLNRILTGLPLGNTSQVASAITCNFVGPEGFSGPYALEGVSEISKLKGVYLHLYGKKESKPFRKLGHFTVLGDDTEECLEIMRKVKSALKIKSTYI